MIADEKKMTYDKKVTCLKCKTSFGTKRTLSRNSRVLRLDPDGCTHYEHPEMDHMIHEANVCPHCHYTFLDKFIAYKGKNEEFDHLLSMVNPSFTYPRTYKESLRIYKLMLLFLEYSPQKSGFQVIILQRIAWINRILGNEKEEKRFLKEMTVKLETIAKEEGSRSGLSEDTIAIRLAEAYITLDEYEKARSWFSLLLTNKGVNPKVREQARKRWQEFKYDS